jgi:hypothetical protein
MAIVIADDNENWRKWGSLVAAWVKGDVPRPATTGELGMLLAHYGIDGYVTGTDRPVNFVVNFDDGPLNISVPGQSELEAALHSLTPEAPLPSFYDVAYGGAPKMRLASDEQQAFALRRLGEAALNGVSMVSHPDYVPPRPPKK